MRSFVLAFSAGTVVSPAFAQSAVAPVDRAASAPARAASAPASATANGYAENLAPKVRKTASTKDTTPYAPIKKPADDGLIPEIEMFVGESRVFPAPGVARIAVGNGGIMTAAALDNKEVILFANGVGTSSLFVWNEDGRYQRVKINIVPGDTSRFAREIAAFLTAIPSAKASIIGDKVIVEGDNLSDSDLLKISKLAERYPQIVNFTNTVGWEQMVMMDVKVVEFPSSVLRDIGLKWNPTGGAAVGAIWSPLNRGNNSGYQIDVRTGSDNAPPIGAVGGTGPVLLPSGLQALSAVNLGLNAQLNLLAQDGKATVLAEPQLSARNGTSASFLAGGEIPYSVSNANGTTISFKPYGIKLDIEPRVDRTGVIRAKIEAEVSAIDSSVTGTSSGPALTTRRTKTEFNLRAGETFVLSGLLQRSLSTDIDKMPLLGDIPVLGALFRSKRYQNKETELVVFVTPTVVDARSPGVVDRIEKTKERLRQNLGEKPYLTDPLDPGRDLARLDSAGATAAVTSPGATPAAPVVAPAAIEGVTPLSPRSVDSVALIPTGESPLQRKSSGSMLQVKRDGLVLHAQPNRRSAALLQLGVGAFVQLGNAEPQMQGTALWRNVVVGELNGWALSDGLAPWKLETASATDSSNFAQVDQGGKLVALGSTGSSGSAGRPGGLTLSAGPTDASPTLYKVGLFKLAMRVTPDVNAPIVAQLTQGETVKGLAEPPRGNWIAVETASGRGWVAGQWLKPLAVAATTQGQ